MVDGGSNASPEESHVHPGRDSFLKSLRHIDAQIAHLVEQRTDLCRRFADDHSTDQLNELRDPFHPFQAVDGSRVGAASTESAFSALARELGSLCRAVVAPVRVVFLGPEFSYSHLAALHQFGQSQKLLPVATIAAVFDEGLSREGRFRTRPA